MDNDLKIIKNKYGEEMLHLCKKIFSTILEYPNRLPKLLEDNFYPSKSLYTDLVKNDKIYDFEKFIYSLFNEKKEDYDTLFDAIEVEYQKEVEETKKMVGTNYEVKWITKTW